VPEYLAPAVYVEETSFRTKSIAGVGTSTAAFVGLTARGPSTADDGGTPGVMPSLLTSVADFESIYGGPDDLTISGAPLPNYLAHAVSAFFANGGSRLYVARVLATGAVAAGSGAINDVAQGDPALTPTTTVSLSGRFKGGATAVGAPKTNLRVTLTQVELVTTKANAVRMGPGVLVHEGANFHVLGTDPFETSASADEWNGLADTTPVTAVTLSVTIEAPGGAVLDFANLGFHRRHPNYAGLVLGPTPPRTADRLTNPLVLNIGSDVGALVLQKALFRTATQRVITLTGGTDGTGAPGIGGYTSALGRLLALEDIAIVAAPGASALGGLDNTLPAAVNAALVTHAETRRAYRIAVLDTPAHLEPGDVRTLKGAIDSSRAALYYPWVLVANPLAATDKTQPSQISLPPSGFVCGIYARTDIERGVWKAPANETIADALGLERNVRFGEQEVLNPLGINCLRFLPNRGFRVWGARTCSSDPEWIYVNVRRYFLYLEASIDQGTQWAVFEPNGERLWANVRSTISDFLYSEWVSGALLGDTPDQAFFVRCDRTTMTQNDLDNGRLICLVGVAALKPAEFVIFRIGQKTADARN
jgi:phage tail sheath protein FI